MIKLICIQKDTQAQTLIHREDTPHFIGATNVNALPENALWELEGNVFQLSLKDEWDLQLEEWFQTRAKAKDVYKL